MCLGVTDWLLSRESVLPRRACRIEVNRSRDWMHSHCAHRVAPMGLGISEFSTPINPTYHGETCETESS